MFSDCSSLKELNLNNFKVNEKTGGRYVFSGCSDKLKRKIRREYKNLNILDFDDFVNDYEDFFG
jgi:surface protein